MNTLTVRFSDAEDLEHFAKYVGKAKQQDGTVGGLWAGLLCSALKRSDIGSLDDAEMARRGALLAQVLRLKRSNHKGSDGNPDRWNVDGGDKTDLGLFLTIKRYMEEGK